jgi:hypothetical protein
MQSEIEVVLESESAVGPFVAYGDHDAVEVEAEVPAGWTVAWDNAVKVGVGDHAHWRAPLVCEASHEVWITADNAGGVQLVAFGAGRGVVFGIAGSINHADAQEAVGAAFADYRSTHDWEPADRIGEAEARALAEECQERTDCYAFRVDDPVAESEEIAKFLAAHLPPA